jgi:inorganic pyrophosphatase/exopolyphosphatase
VNVVMGNESCDLDSSISTLVYAYLLYSEMSTDTRQTVATVPLLNICKKDLPLKTEVTYYLKKNGIPLDLLVFQLGISNHLRVFVIGRIWEAQFKCICHVSKIQLTTIFHYM